MRIVGILAMATFMGLAMWFWNTKGPPFGLPLLSPTGAFAIFLGFIGLLWLIAKVIEAINDPYSD